MGLVSNANHFDNSLSVQELLSFKVEKVFFLQAENRQSFSRFV